MKEFVEYIIRNLVDAPLEVDVRSLQGEQGFLVEVRVAAGDVGKVVGRQGNTIRALRTIVSAISARLGTHVKLELIESEDVVEKIAT